MNRWKAFVTHLLCSFVIVGGIAAAALLLWFPHGLYRVAGLDRLLLIMLALDLTAGPLLTLVIFKAGKRGLKFDLTVIALCQLAFLGYGLHTLWGSRPVFLVGNGLRFNLMFASDLEPEQLAKAPKPEWRRLSWTGPQLVGAQAPRDKAGHDEAMDYFFSAGVDLERLPRYYVPYEQVAPQMLAKAQVGADGVRHVPIVSRMALATMELDAQGRPKRVVVP